MSSLFIEGINAPNEIKAALKNLSKDYQIIREVTKGSNGYLFFGINRILNTKVAIKFYYWGGDAGYHAEPNVLAQIRSENVLSVHNAGLLDNEWAYFVTPYCPKGDLDDVLARTKFGNIAAIDLTCQLLNGISYLHERRFLHRDLKPANIYIGETSQAIIGDFGSIKTLPENTDAIPASSHSVLYRPPESVVNNKYGFLSDIYQCGIVLFQLLGGNLPYSEIAWLSRQERNHYNSLTDSVDKTIFADQCLKTKICKGKILDISSLPPWVSENLKRTIRKAVNIVPEKRFQSASAFHVHLNNLKASVPNWSLIENHPVLKSSTSYRIVNESEIIVQKRRDNGKWRRDNSIQASNISEAVAAINEKESKRGRS